MNLASYIFRRLLAVLPLLLFLPLLTLLLMHLVPGNYFDSIRLNPQISPDLVKQYERLYHLDEPVLVQYFYWLRNLARLDLGYSFAYRQPVMDILGSRLWNTFLLSGVSFFIAWAFAVVLGLLAGLYKHSLFDRLLKSIAYIGLSLPNFFLCLILLAVAARWGHLPLGGMKSVYHETLPFWGRVADVARHMIVPVSVLSLASFAYLFRLMRSQTVETRARDFVLHLRARRIPEWKIIFKHIARNAINPMISLFGMELPALFSGAALVEIFTGWPGLGQVMLQAVRMQDMFLVLGNMTMIAFLLVAGNLAADVLLAMTDPRIRLAGRTA